MDTEYKRRVTSAFHFFTFASFKLLFSFYIKNKRQQFLFSPLKQKLIQIFLPPLNKVLFVKFVSVEKMYYFWYFFLPSWRYFIFNEIIYLLIFTVLLLLFLPLLYIVYSFIIDFFFNFVIYLKAFLRIFIFINLENSNIFEMCDISLSALIYILRLPRCWFELLIYTATCSLMRIMISIENLG